MTVLNTSRNDNTVPKHFYSQKSCETILYFKIITISKKSSNFETVWKDCTIYRQNSLILSSFMPQRYFMFTVIIKFKRHFLS